MEKQKTFFDYGTQALALFGFTAAVFLIFAVLFGDIAQEVSTLFSLGSRGLSLSTLAQLLLLSVWIVCLRFVFFTETILRHAGVVARTVGMISGTVVSIILFVVAFRWFPADMPLAWLSFFLCFSVCFVLSFCIASYKDRLENRKMAQALEQMKNRAE